MTVRKPRGRTRVVSRGKKPPKSGAKTQKKTEFQKLLEKWGKR